MKQLLIAFFLLSGLALGQNITDATKQLKNLPQAVQAQVSTHNLSVPANCIAHSGSATAYTCTTSPTFTPAVGDHIQFEADVANTGTATLAVNGAAAATIHKQGGSATIVANDLLAGHWISATFDGTYWQLEGQLGNAASTSPCTVTGVGSSSTCAFPGSVAAGATVSAPEVIISGTPTNNTDGDTVGARNAAITAAVPAASTLVHTTGAETIAGVKSFSSSPTVPTPTNGTDAANKAYVLANAGSAPAGSVGDIQTNGGSGALGSVPQSTFIPATQKSGNGTQVVTALSGFATAPAGLTPCTDGSGNISATCSATSAGLGTYIFTVARNDSDCSYFAASGDGKAVRPLYWPIDPATNANYCGGGTGTPASGGSGEYSALFMAPWNSTYYLISGNTTYNIASSPDMSTWTNIATLANNSTNGNSASAPSWFFDTAASCPNQDYTCLHAITGYALSGAIADYEVHPTNSTLTTWSNPVELGAGVIPYAADSWDPFMLNYQGTYYLFTDTANCGSNYNNSECYDVWSASSPTGTYSHVTTMAQWASAPPSSTECSAVYPYTCPIESLSIVQTATGYRAYLHNAALMTGMFYMETTGSPVANTGWTNYTEMATTNDMGATHLQVFRASDQKTVGIVAASARQSVLPLATPRGAANCDGFAFNTPGSGGAFSGGCRGFEHVKWSQNSDGYDALRVIMVNPSFNPAGIMGNPLQYGNGQNGAHVDFGYYSNLTTWTDVMQLTPTSLNAPNVVAKFNRYVGQTKTCTIPWGTDDSTTPLTTANIQPQRSQCLINEAATLQSIVVMNKSGAASVQVGFRHGTTTTSLSGVLTPATVAGITDTVACANTGGTAMTITGVSVTCSILTNTTLAAGDVLETVGGAGDGTTVRQITHVTWTEN